MYSIVLLMHNCVDLQSIKYEWLRMVRETSCLIAKSSHEQKYIELSHQNQLAPHPYYINDSNDVGWVRT